MQQIQTMSADAAKQLPSAIPKLPSHDGLLAALRDVSKFVSPGFYVLDEVISQLVREARELEEAASSPPPGGSTESATTTDDKTASLSRTASPEARGV